MDFFYIYVALVIISLAVSVASIYGMGAYDHDKNSAIYTFSTTGFNVSIVVLSVSCILLIKNAQATMVCNKAGIKKKAVSTSAPEVKSAMRQDSAGTYRGDYCNQPRLPDCGPGRRYVEVTT